eukprot:TRINITY_DN9033_c0_g1_i1.p1 TRINITY_DN9033_c0_g1~~TRINITY_DN9033_c0_g1_i1.p1  ORF type:complete len:388 (-),score=92.67 TRINITY_DN9033_c0_g1_i1:37-1062(-)
MVVVPESLRLVSDLSHHLRRLFRMPPVPAVLGIDGFVLHPSSRIEDVLRDDDVVEVFRADLLPESPASSPRTRPSAKRRCLGTREPLALDAGGGQSAKELQPRRLFDAAGDASAPGALAAAAPAAVAAPAASPLLALPAPAEVAAVASAPPRRRQVSRSPSSSSSSSAAATAPQKTDTARSGRCQPSSTSSSAAPATPAAAASAAGRQGSLVNRPPTRADINAAATVASEEDLLRWQVQACAGDMAQAFQQVVHLRRLVREQMEHYLGDGSYPSDRWLQRQADEDGFLPMSLLAGFNRMMELVGALVPAFRVAFVASCLEGSEVIETSPCGEWLRRRHALP